MRLPAAKAGGGSGAPRDRGRRRCGENLANHYRCRPVVRVRRSVSSADHAIPDEAHRLGVQEPDQDFGRSALASRACGGGETGVCKTAPRGKSHRFAYCGGANGPCLPAPLCSRYDSRPGSRLAFSQAARQIQPWWQSVYPGVWSRVSLLMSSHESHSGIIDNMYFGISRQINNSTRVDGSLSRWDPAAQPNACWLQGWSRFR